MIQVSNVTKTFEGPARFTALKNVSFDVSKGEFVTIRGRSGCGKSTLLNMLTGIDAPSSGRILVAGAAVHSMGQKELSLWRGRNIGIVFQFFQLLPTLTVAENVMLPMDFCNTFRGAQRRSRAMELLERAGVADQADKLPSSLSGGQQQRVAIARALANDPPILAADEPTGNLDSITSEGVISLFSRLSEEGKTVIMVTHERDMSGLADRELVLEDGALLTGVALERGKAYA